MSALLTLMAVIRSAVTQMDHLCAVVGVDSFYWRMERLVWRSMSVHWVHTIANSNVSMKMVDSGVNVLLGIPSILIKEPVQASFMNSKFVVVKTATSN